MLHANFMALCFIEPKLLLMEVYIAEIGICRRPDVSREGRKFYPLTVFLSLFFINTPRSAAT